MINYENLLKESKVYKTIMADMASNTLAHCYMIVSEDSVACNNLCLLIARAMLCENHSNCGKCKSCSEVENMVNPSLIFPVELSSDGIKEFITRCSYSVEGETKVVLINNFQDIDGREQNRLLKLLEEPVGNTIFILGVTRISNVLETIKSRAIKLYLEEFSTEDIKNALKDEYGLLRVREAVDFAEGSLTKSIEILDDDNFMDCYNTMVDILIEMKNSSMVLSEMAKLDLNYKKQYLDALEVILKQILEHTTKQKESDNDKIIQLSSLYNIPTLVNINDLLISSRRKLEQYCGADMVFNTLFMGILEVKYKCR